MRAGSGGRRREIASPTSGWFKLLGRLLSRFGDVVGGRTDIVSGISNTVRGIDDGVILSRPALHVIHHEESADHQCDQQDYAYQPASAAAAKC